MLLAACSSSGSQSSPPPANAPSSHATSATPLPSLAGQLLRVTDLPTGWAEDHSKSDDSSSGCASAGTLSKKTAEKKTASFAENGNLPALGETLGYLPTAAATSFKTGVKALDHCHKFTLGDGTKVALGRTSFPKVADDSAAYTASASIQGVNVTVDILAFRKGNYVALMDYEDIGSADIDAFVKFAREAAGKVH